VTTSKHKTISESELSAAIFDTVAAVLIVVTPDGTIVRFNQAAEQTTGYSREEVIGKQFRDIFVIPEDSAAIEQAVKDLQEKMSKVTLETKWRRKDGNLRLISWTSTVLLDENNTIQYLVGTGIDITEQRAASEALLRSESRLKNVITSNMIGLLYWNKQGQITDANDTVLNMIGYTREELKQGLIRWDLMTPAEFWDRERHAHEELAAKGVCTPFEKEYIHKDGTRIPILLGGAMLEGSDNDGVCFVLDISQRKKAEKQALDAVRSRDEFMSIASHELKTPITSLRMGLQILRKPDLKLEDTTARSLIETCEQQARRLGVLVDELLDLTRIRSGKIGLKPCEADLVEIVKNVVKGFLTPETPTPEMPHIEILGETSLRGQWDPTRISQIVTNLVSNAIKYGAGKPVEIKIEYLKSHDIARLSVCDHGIGIPHEKQKQIFDRFERLELSRPIGGLGLGLYISRQLTEAHGGKIQVESEPGKGSVFSVELPLVRR
jgi:PAS domain S-box-containing protein